ncbi:PH domain-containing protein [Knoellia sp. 3-2P3]|uniref:PH domain-containing protein n=1 Tax=unclassified Knoellia TaxID=2618719 RepID=UPI0023DB0F93|nr:PH domain-containing protein [Knoellia sp. 3-2P3]MDF2091013.1 PH domain-containing protein [Knoellia sp. 3-2P3]
MARSLTSPNRELDRYLLDGERLVTAVHQHWGKVAEPVATALVSGALVLWVDATIPARFGLVSTLLWWAWFAVVGRTAYRVAEWRHDWFVATDKRLLLFYGFITRKVSMMPLSKVTDMSYTRSVPGRLFGYGRFVMESAGQDQALREVNWVPSPDTNYRAICTEIFRLADRRFQDAPRHEARAGAVPDPAAPASSLPSPYAGWDDERHSTAIRVETPRDGTGESLYRSPDRRGGGRVDRDADTGPIPHLPPRDRWDDERR